jgi:2,4-dienoyl-CoA reductase-like NADH-dependent reductase (Old Yellow Enzyme family)
VAIITVENFGLTLLQSNVRSDEYSSIPETALHLLHRIVIAIRAVVPKEFALGVKFNAADYLDDEDHPPSTNSIQQEDRALNHVSAIASWGSVDFIEISGGDYEKPGPNPAKNCLPGI